MYKTHMLCEKDPYQSQRDASVLFSDDEGIVLDETVFYAAGGGQPGDSGLFQLPNGQEVHIVDTRRVQRDPPLVLHVPHAKVRLAPGTQITTRIDWQRRYRHMRMHTCLHLLCSIVNAPVTGCAISDDKGRLDFDLPEPTLGKEDVTEQLNALINRGLAVITRTISADDLVENHHFIKSQSLRPPIRDGRVRIVEIEGVDIQPCGGTHVLNTSEIGEVECRKIEKKSRYNRRVVIGFV